MNKLCTAFSWRFMWPNDTNGLAGRVSMNNTPSNCLPHHLMHLCLTLVPTSRLLQCILFFHTCSGMYTVQSRPQYKGSLTAQVQDEQKAFGPALTAEWIIFRRRIQVLKQNKSRFNYLQTSRSSQNQVGSNRVEIESVCIRIELFVT